MITFKQFLYEMNFGAFQKDERFVYLFDILIKDIQKTLKVCKDISNLSGLVENISLSKKYKSKENVQVDIEWRFEPTYSIGFGVESFCESGKVRNKHNFVEFELVLICDKTGRSDGKYKQDIKNLISSNEIKPILYHEIQHILDMVDGKFSQKHLDKYKTATKSSPYDIISKYASQDIERENFLTSVITDLSNLKKDLPNLEYEDAIELSKDYQKFMSRLKPNLKNKYKAKIFYYWTTINN